MGMNAELPPAPWSEPELLACDELIPGDRLAIATILGEAASEPYEGKLAVARVIRERMRLHYASDGTIAGTVLAPLQFSMWNTHDRGRIRVCKALSDHPGLADCKRAWFEVLREAPPPDFERVVHYHADYIPKPSWALNHALVARVFHIGRHIFYRLISPTSGAAGGR